MDKITLLILVLELFEDVTPEVALAIIKTYNENINIIGDILD